MLTVDFEAGLVRVREHGVESEYPLDSQQAFAAVSRPWLRCGWEELPGALAMGKDVAATEPLRTGRRR